MKRHRHLLFAASTFLLTAGCRRPAPPDIRTEGTSTEAVTALPTDLYLAADSSAILMAARQLMEADQNVALTTVDATGQPRTRTVNARLANVDPSDPRKGMTVWVLTRASTRKVEQIRTHPNVTLYFNDDAKIIYLSIMGTAVLHDDPADPRVQPFLDAETRQYFGPDFPREFMVIEVRPRWLEYLSPALPGHKERWTPQAVVFTPQ